MMLKWSWNVPHAIKGISTRVIHGSLGSRPSQWAYDLCYPLSRKRLIGPVLRFWPTSPTLFSTRDWRRLKVRLHPTFDFKMGSGESLFRCQNEHLGPTGLWQLIRILWHNHENVILKEYKFRATSVRQIFYLLFCMGNLFHLRTRLIFRKCRYELFTIFDKQTSHIPR